MGASNPSADNKFGAMVAAGWREPVNLKGYKMFKITFDSILVNDDHDPSFSGEWQHLWAGNKWKVDRVVGTAWLFWTG